MPSEVSVAGLSSQVPAQLGLVIIVLAIQWPSWWAQRWVQDDAYVSFRYAHNLVRGEGLVYFVHAMQITGPAPG